MSLASPRRPDRAARPRHLRLPPSRRFPPCSGLHRTGAGFAFLSSFLVLFLTFFLALVSFLSWPFRFLVRLIRGTRSYKGAVIDRLVIVGLDGMEPALAEKYMAEGRLPNLARLKSEGTYARLQTTTPGDLARGLVVVHDRVGAVQAQYLRFPEP